MLKVGITGGIGSGKTSACNFFEIIGIPVFNADLEAKKIINSDIALKIKLIRYFGESIYFETGNINKEVFAKIIFSDKVNLEKSNSIIHPVVLKYYETWCFKNRNHKYTIKEAAILFESGTNNQMDIVITVTAPLEQRIERVMKRDGISSDLILKKINNQLSDEYKIQNSDFVIYNNNDRLIIPQIIEIDKFIKGKS
jgi:dephospho-CoA kinase